MYVADGPELREPDDCTRFSVMVSAAAELTTADGYAFVPVDWLRAQAAGRVGPDWPDRFAEMLAFAASRGWMSEDGSQVRGHLT